MCRLQSLKGSHTARDIRGVDNSVYTDLKNLYHLTVFIFTLLSPISSERCVIVQKVTAPRRNVLDFDCSSFRRSVSVWQVTPLMLPKLTAVHESLPTDHTPVRSLSCVDPSVHLEAGGLSEPLAADVAAVHLLPQVNHRV